MSGVESSPIIIILDAYARLKIDGTCRSLLATLVRYFISCSKKSGLNTLSLSNEVGDNLAGDTLTGDPRYESNY